MTADHLLSPVPIAQALGLGGSSAWFEALSVLIANGDVFGISQKVGDGVRTAGHDFEFADARKAGLALVAPAGEVLRIAGPFPFLMHAEPVHYWLNGLECTTPAAFSAVSVPPSRMANALRADEIIADHHACAASVCRNPSHQKDEPTLGFINLTDMAPLAIAKDKGDFEDEGLFVTLKAQSNWKVLLDRVIAGEIEAHTCLRANRLPRPSVTGPRGGGLRISFVGPERQCDDRVQSSLGRDEAQRAIGCRWQAAAPDRDLCPETRGEADAAEGTQFNPGMVFPVSSHNYELRYWRAVGGIDPGLYSADGITGQIGGDVLISVTPAPQMPATLGNRHHRWLCGGQAVEPGRGGQGPWRTRRDRL